MHLPEYKSIGRRRRELRPACDRLDDRCLLSGLTPAEVTAAYGLDGITFTSPNGSSVAGDGAGETIALIEAFHDPNLCFRLADLRPGVRTAESSAVGGRPGG